jgi:Putative cyclase
MGRVPPCTSAVLTISRHSHAHPAPSQFAHIPTNTFYNGVRAADICGPSANHKGSIHHWANHGLTGRALLLDYYSYAQSQQITYSAYDAHGISYADLAACGQAQGIDIRPAAQGGDIKIGDILLIRSGFVAQYHQTSREERNRLALREHTVDPVTDGQRYAGLKQEEPILDWLHDCYFAAVGGDAPAFERWPTTESYYLHEYILALWGMPLGEMLDLERLSTLCKEKERWTFFFTSAVNNCPGGVSSHVNGTAIF